TRTEAVAYALQQNLVDFPGEHTS
ncbi:MAG TPA: DNA-binding response regulator, partial [Chloroflexi bacterium]|nr:DNA-binding response regulator [Chloroflexota bacterium]